MAPSRKKPDGTQETRDVLLDDVVSALLADTGSRRKKSTKKTTKSSSKKSKGSEPSIKPLPLEWSAAKLKDEDPTDADVRLREFMQGKRALIEKDGSRHYFENNGRTYTLEEVGQIMAVTRERVRQIEEHALRKMWRLIRSMNLREDLEESDWIDIIGGGSKSETFYT